MKKGDKVYVVYDDTRNKPHYSNIISVGSKYIIIGNIHRDYSRFDKMTKRSVDAPNGYNCRAMLFENEEAYNKHVLRKNKEALLKNKLISYIKTLECDKLEEIYKILGLYGSEFL